PVIRGAYFPRDALDVMLAKTGYQYEFVNSRTVAIRVANAQSSDRNEGGSSPGTTAAARSPDNDAVGTPVLTEVIVTAQRRAERLRDVPISISVLEGAELDKATGSGITDAINRMPGVSAM